MQEEVLERYDFSNLVGNSGPIRRVYEQVTQVAPANTTVMLRGESGTGKELIAHAVHYNSPRRNSPFVKVNCAALPETPSKNPPLHTSRNGPLFVGVFHTLNQRHAQLYY